MVLNLRRKSSSSGSNKLPREQRRPSSNSHLPEQTSSVRRQGSASYKRRSSASLRTSEHPMSDAVSRGARRSVTADALPSATRRAQARTGARQSRRPSSGIGLSSLRGVARWRLVIAAFLLATLLFFSVYLGLSKLPLFAIENIEVQETAQLSKEQILGLAQVSVGENLFKLDKKGIKERLLQHPWVDEVKISSKYPHTLQIAIKEKDVVAIVVLKGGQEAWYISSAGDWVQPLALQITAPEPEPSLDQKPEEVQESATSDAKSSDKKKDQANSKDKAQKSNSKSQDDSKKKDAKSQDKETDKPDVSKSEGVSLETPMQAALQLQHTLLGQAAKKASEEGRVLIYEVEDSLAPKVGERVPDGGVSASLQYLREFSENLAPQIIQMTCPNKSSVMAMLKNGIQISLGAPKNQDEVSLKESVILNLLEQHEGEITYINVRVPAQPAWRGVELKTKKQEDKADKS